jgi:hypothetical protein
MVIMGPFFIAPIIGSLFLIGGARMMATGVALRHKPIADPRFGQ